MVSMDFLYLQWCGDAFVQITIYQYIGNGQILSFYQALAIQQTS